MFERYNEKARRVIFFARYEASQFGQANIETEHLLLGLLREDKDLTRQFLKTPQLVESIRKEIEKHTTMGEKIPTSVDLPLSKETMRVLAYAAEEAERLEHKHIGTAHLLLGLLREGNSFAATILGKRGIELARTREVLARMPAAESSNSAKPAGASELQSLSRLCKDLTDKASNGELQPVIAREAELEALIEVLCRKDRRNPVLVGERGAGKTAIVEALALRITEGKVPKQLTGTRLLALSAEALSAWSPARERFQDLAKLLGTIVPSGQLILFVDGLRGPGKGLAGVIKFAIEEAETQCIGAATEREYRSCCDDHPRLDRIFCPLYVKPLDAAATLAVLMARKQQLEDFHQISFEADALECAIQRADAYLPGRILPGKALELLDGAAAEVNLRELPSEVAEARKKIGFIETRLDQAIANHEFEKARFYDEELRKERRALADLSLQFGIEPASVVNRNDVEQVIGKWNRYPYSY